MGPDLNLPDMSFGWMLFKTLLALVFILGLATFFIKYVMPRLQGMPANSGKRESILKIMDRIPLDARKSLYVVKAGKKRLVVGVSEQGIYPIANLEENDMEGYS